MTGAASETRIPALDGLRGLAAATVAFSHFSNKTALFDRLYGDGNGQLGVMLFFCLSGYLMASLYLRTPCSKSAVGEFARRRFARIGPLFLLVFALSDMWRHVTGTPWPFYNVHLVDLTGFRELDGVLWTIPVEVQFYLVFPLLWALFRFSNRACLIAVIAIVTTVELFRFSAGTVRPFCNVFFLVGLLAAVTPPLSARIMNGIFFVGLAAYVLGAPEVMRRIGIVALPHADSWVPLWRLPGHLLIMPVLVWSAAHSPIARRLLGGSMASGLGNISYSVYLLHFPLLSVLSADPLIRGNPAFFFFLFTLLTLTVATLSYRYIELPARAAINRRALPGFLLRRHSESATAV